MRTVFKYTPLDTNTAQCNYITHILIIIIVTKDINWFSLTITYSTV